MKQTKRRIAFTLPGAESTWTGGINYLRSLMNAINAAEPEDTELLAYVAPGVQQEKLGLPASVKFIRTAILQQRSPMWWADELVRRMSSRSPLLSRRLRADGVTVHSHGLPSHQLPLRSIGWIPDFQHLHLPHLFSSRELQLRDQHFHAIAACNDIVVLSSEDARQDFIRFSPTSREKARVLQFAALPQDYQGTSLHELRDTYDLKRPYFYVPNQLWVHKNHSLLIDALRISVRREPRLLIVCSGSTHDPRSPGHFDELRQKMQKAGVADNIRFLGLIPYQHIAPLMVHSTAVINPSLFEGWSTTVEEAKALGVSLILSDINVHREQCGPDATYFEATSADALASILDIRFEPLFPKWAVAQIESALAAHKQRVLAFGREYLQLVDEAAGSK